MLKNLKIQWLQLRWPVVMSAVLLMPLGLNAPAISQSPVKVAQIGAIADAVQLRKNRRLWNQQNIVNLLKVTLP